MATDQPGAAAPATGPAESALHYLRQAFTITDEHDYPPGQFLTSYALAGAYRDIGRYSDALDFAHRALTITRSSRFAMHEVATLYRLGTIHLRLGDHEKAQQHHQQALTLARNLAETQLVAMALNGLAETSAAAGAPTDVTRQPLPGRAGRRHRPGRAVRTSPGAGRPRRPPPATGRTRQGRRPLAAGPHHLPRHSSTEGRGAAGKDRQRPTEPRWYLIGPRTHTAPRSGAVPIASGGMVSRRVKGWLLLVGVAVVGGAGSGCWRAICWATGSLARSRVWCSRCSVCSAPGGGR